MKNNLLFLIFLSFLLIGCWEECMYEKKDNTKIYSLKQMSINNSIEGNFSGNGSFLWANISGSSNSDITFYGYVLTDEGIVLRKFPRTITKIFEDQEENEGYVIVYDIFSEATNWNKGCCNPYNKEAYHYKTIKNYFEIHIPKNTITKNYNIDLKGKNQLNEIY